MELQLGLALPNHNPTKGLDLNNHGFEPSHAVGSRLFGCGGVGHVKDKRNFEEAFGMNARGQSLARTPSLLLWSGQPNEEDDQKGPKKPIFSTMEKDDGEENEVVGWPPIKSWRKKWLYQPHQGGRINSNQIALEKQNNGNMYVKVKMEGVAIARKINLGLFNSYQALTNSLISMFAKYKKCDSKDARFTLTYQDKEGDWLLAGDVPWQTFIRSVQRLEIRRNEC